MESESEKSQEDRSRLNRVDVDAPSSIRHQACQTRIASSSLKQLSTLLSNVQSNLFADDPLVVRPVDSHALGH